MPFIGHYIRETVNKLLILKVTVKLLIVKKIIKSNTQRIKCDLYI